MTMLTSDQLADIARHLDLWVNGDHATAERLVDYGPGTIGPVPVWYIDVLTLLTDASETRDEIAHLTAELRVANQLGSGP